MSTFKPPELNSNQEEPTAYLEREGIKLADFERWRIALEEDGQGSTANTRKAGMLVMGPITVRSTPSRRPRRHKC